MANQNPLIFGAPAEKPRLKTSRKNLRFFVKAIQSSLPIFTMPKARNDPFWTKDVHGLKFSTLYLSHAHQVEVKD